MLKLGFFPTFCEKGWKNPNFIIFVSAFRLKDNNTNDKVIKL